MIRRSLEEGLGTCQLFPLGIPISDKGSNPLLAEIQKLSPNHVPYLIHNDLKREYILIKSTGQIRGILDWTMPESEMQRLILQACHKSLERCCGGYC